MAVKYYYIFFILLLANCAKKVTDVKPAKQEIIVKEPDKKQPLNPCVGFGELTDLEKERAETSFVLYRDDVKQGRFAEALAHWKIAFNLAPGSNGRVKYHFEDGAAIYKHFYDNASDRTLKKLYVDTIMMIYDKRKECFGDEAYVNGLKGFDYYYYYSEYSSPENMYNLFKSNFDVKGKNADYFVVNPFTKLLFDRVSEGSISKDEGRKYAELILKTIENGLSNCKGNSCETWKIINEYAPERLEGLEGIDGFYDCSYYADKYYALYKSSPDSCDIINLAYTRLLRGGCPDSDSRLAELKNVKNNKCYVAPPALSCAAKGNEEYGKGNYSKAVESYLKCVEQANETEQKSKYLLLIAKIYFRDLKNFPKARKFALDAAKLKNGWGEPFILIGNLYASSGPLCGTGRGWESQVVTWSAIDMWNKAKSIDPKVSAEATNLINRYKQYMPNKEDIFFRNIKVGDTFFVPCWIQDNTIVRTAD